MKVLVCGSRDWSDQTALWSVLSGFIEPGVCVLIEGEAPGADSMARDWALNEEQPIEQYPADWEKHGKAAGPIRNQQMLDEGKPELVLAFVNKPLAESRGTADMVRRAKAAGIPTYVVEAM